MSKDFELSELDDFARAMLNLATRKMTVEVRRFMTREGNKLKRLTAKKAKQLVKTQTGNYLKGIKRGRVYQYEGSHAIRVYGSSPHAHLIEHGHRIVRGRNVIGFARGKRVFTKSSKEFEVQYFKDVEEFVDELLDKGLR